MRTESPPHDTAQPGARPSAVAVIPARYQSSRFPGKALADLCGKPLIEHVYRRVADTPGLDAVLVATDDERIADVVTSFGGRAVMTRSDHRSGTDRIAEVAASLTSDVIVNVQGDEPLIEPAMIAQALRPFATAPDAVMSTLRRRLDRDADYRSPHVVKVVVDEASNALYFSRAPIPYERDAPAGRLPESCWQHIGLYAYRRDFLIALARLPPTPLELLESLEQLRVLEHGYRITAVETTFEAIGVDTPADLERVRLLLTTAASTR